MMAVPFALPEDEINNLIAAVIFILSQTRLERAVENHELQECMEELVRLLVEELKRRSRSSEYDNQLRQALFLLRRTLNQFTPSLSRIPRRSFDSESSCCDDTKLSVEEVDAVEDCSQEDLREKEKFVEATFLSRLVPGVRRTFWTAVPLICMVGWHLFQTSYCM